MSTQTNTANYSRTELRTIADNIQQYIRDGVLDYSFTQCSGKVVTHQGGMSATKREQLWHIIKDLNIKYGTNTEATKTKQISCH